MSSHFHTATLIDKFLRRDAILVSYPNTRKVTVRRLSRGAVVLRNGSNVFQVDVGGFDRLYVGKAEDGGHAIVGEKTGHKQMIALFGSNQIAESALSKLFAVHTFRWGRWIKQVAMLVVGVAIAQSLATTLTSAPSRGLASAAPVSDLASPDLAAQMARLAAADGRGAVAPQMAAPQDGPPVQHGEDLQALLSCSPK